MSTQMCKCTPEKRTPFCGGPGCEVPAQNGVQPNETSIVLKSGIFFDFADPQPEMVVLEDIAWHLSRIRRFSGMGVTVAELINDT